MGRVKDARYWMETLGLEEHPEGGFYRLTYTAEQRILPPGFPGERAASTGIYFLLSGELGERGRFSAFHRLRSDEMWHFYAGGPLVVHVIAPDGTYSRLLLGRDCEEGQQFQAVVKAGCWFASAPLSGDGFALVGCTVAPGFDFEDFELAERDALRAEYPQHAELIRDFTRG